jgi:GNAT superfamily N-acetyltransferase
MIIRAARPVDRDAWLALWDGYNRFYGRPDLSAAITQTTWSRFHDPAEPVHALVADDGGRLVGLAHYLFHRSTAMIEPNCYLQDLFTSEAMRGRGVGRALIEAVYREAAQAGARRVYWQTHESNVLARRLYDQVAEHSGFIVYRKSL